MGLRSLARYCWLALAGSPCCAVGVSVDNLKFIGEAVAPAPEINRLRITYCGLPSTWSGSAYKRPRFRVRTTSTRFCKVVQHSVLSAVLPSELLRLGPLRAATPCSLAGRPEIHLRIRTSCSLLVATSGPSTTIRNFGRCSPGETRRTRA